MNIFKFKSSYSLKYQLFLQKHKDYNPVLVFAFNNVLVLT